MNRTRTMPLIAAALVGVGLLAGCASDADVASENLKKAAEQFEVNRRIVAYNTILDTYVMEVTGRCSLAYPSDRRAEVTCKLEDGTFALNTIILGDNVAVSSEQINGTDVDTDQYRVIFKPEVIVPNIDRP